MVDVRTTICDANPPQILIFVDDGSSVEFPPHSSSSFEFRAEGKDTPKHY
jgi:hypothetical protein